MWHRVFCGSKHEVRTMLKYLLRRCEFPTCKGKIEYSSLTSFEGLCEFHFQNSIRINGKWKLRKDL
jgi:hypothetical protein